MMQTRTKSCVLFGVAVLLIGWAAGAHADLMQPAAVIDHTGPYLGNEWSFAPEYLINGRGIVGYNGQTEVTASSLHNYQQALPDGQGGNSWMSGPTADALGEYLVFDFEGEAFEITGIYVWPWLDLGTLNRSIKDVDVYVGDSSVVPQTTKADWRSALTYATSITVQQAALLPDTPAQSFSLDTPVSNVQYVMFDIRTTYGGDAPATLYPGCSEVAFEGTPVPEPSTLVLLGFGFLSVLACWRRRK